MLSQRISGGFALLILLTSTVAQGKGYNTYFDFKAPTEAFVGQKATYTLLFGLDTTSPPAGIISNREIYSGYVDFGNGSQVPFLRASLNTVPGTTAEAIRNVFFTYTTAGTYITSASLNLHDDVCTTNGCFPIERTFTTNSQTVKVYSANSVNDLVKSAIETARAQLQQGGNANPTDAEVARRAYEIAVRAREAGGVQTSTDPQLRDVEYMLRGYAGGALARNPGQIGGTADYANDIANLSGPIGAGIYNIIKVAGGNVSGNGLPASSPGGMQANWQGWRTAVFGGSLNDLTSNPAFDAPLNTPDSSQSNPLTPSGSFVTPDGTQINHFGVDVQPGVHLFLDPPSSDVIAFSVAGNLFRSLNIHLSEDWAANDLLLGFAGTEARYSQGTEFLFDPDSIGGVDYFYIRGLQLTGTGPFVADLTFAYSGRAVVFQTGLSEAAVPEPSTWTMILFGFGAIGVALRRRKSLALHRAS